MKVEILTIHRLNNFGSAFQAMALYQYIHELGVDAELLDYHPSYYTGRKLRNYIGRLLFYRSFRQRQQKFDRFIEAYTSLSDKRYRTLQELEKGCPQADLYIAGGDQLWNYHHMCGNDDAYKLVFWNGKKISYGTSMGGTCFPESQMMDLKCKLADFAYLSLRERQSVEELAEIGIKAEWVVDPVMLLDSERYYSISRKPQEKEKYVFVYLVAPSQLLNDTVAYLRDICHYKVIVYSGLAHKCKCDVQKRSLGPEEVIGYIQNAEFVLSSSFHATVFSILFKKRFGVILPGEKTNERILDLLSWTGITDTIILESANIQKTITKEVWYTEETEERIAKRIALSKQYLKNAIEACM